MVALCNDPAVYMVPLPSADPPEVNAVNTIETLLHSHTSVNHTNNNFPQASYNISTSTNNSTNNSPQNNTIHPHDQSTILLQQFSVITQELKNSQKKYPVTSPELHMHLPQLRKTQVN